MADSSKPSSPIKARKKGTRNATRPRPLPPDVTARNLAYEKERRQALNEDFLDLARLVPSLATARRLSKVLIVNEAKSHLRQRRLLCIAAARDMKHLLEENARLSAELSAAHLQAGQPAAEAMAPTAAMKELIGVEAEPAGVFPPGSWDNWSGRPRKPSESKSVEAADATAPVSGLQDTSLSGSVLSPPTAAMHSTQVQGDGQATSFSELFIHGLEADGSSYLQPDMTDFLADWPDSLADPWQSLPANEILQFQ